MALRNTGRYRAEKGGASKSKFELGAPNVPRENTAEGRLLQANENVRIDNLYGFNRVTDNKERIGYLINMHATEIVEEDKRLISGVDYYFLEEDCTRFKVSLPYHPYFYIKCRKDSEQEVSTFLLKKYNGIMTRVETIKKEDLDLPNHLSGLLQKYLKLFFANLIDMQKVRQDIRRAVKVNLERNKGRSYYSDFWAAAEHSDFPESSTKKKKRKHNRPYG